MISGMGKAVNYLPLIFSLKFVWIDAHQKSFIQLWLLWKRFDINPLVRVFNFTYLNLISFIPLCLLLPRILVAKTYETSDFHLTVTYFLMVHDDTIILKNMILRIYWKLTKGWFHFRRALYICNCFLCISYLFILIYYYLQHCCYKLNFAYRTL